MPEPLEIVIRKNDQAEGVAPGQPGAGAAVGESSSVDKKGGLTTETKAVNAALIGAAKQIALNGIRMAGDITGDYAAQEYIGAGLSIGADVAMVAKAGWVGAIAVGSKYATGIANSFIGNFNAQKENDMLRSRTGAILVSGSRYTDD